MKQVIIKYTPSIGIKARLQYVLDFLNGHPLNKGLNFKLAPTADAFLTIGYGVSGGDISITSQDTFFSKKEISTSSYVANIYTSGSSRLYSVEQGRRAVQAFSTNDQIAFDIFETIFFHISRYEEVFCSPANIGQAGWLNEEFHFLIRYELQQIPVVDELVKAFFELIQKKKIQHKTTYDLTHDIDVLARFTPAHKFFRSLAATLFYRRGSAQFFKSIAHFTSMLKGEKNDPYDSFDYLFRDEAIWREKVIYLMAGGNSTYDNKYKLSDKALDYIMYLAKDRCYKIGLHPSYNAGFDGSMYINEQKALSKKAGHPILYNRQHWLRFNWQITPYIFSENDIQLDSSMGYNAHLGFRCGTGFSYHMYDFKNETAFGWKEQPMACMESSAIHLAKHMVENLMSLMEDFLRANRFNTHIVFNFHNSNFDPLLDSGNALIDFYKNKLIPLIEAD